jgi:hypothetical protein
MRVALERVAWAIWVLIETALSGLVVCGLGAGVLLLITWLLRACGVVQ